MVSLVKCAAAGITERLTKLNVAGKRSHIVDVGVNHRLVH